MKLLLIRTDYEEKQTLGVLYVLGERNEVLFECKTLELPDKNNERRVSCIYEGVFKVEKRISPKFGLHFHITDVKGRSYILIHSGNFHSQILGCILVGSDFKDINADGYLDVIQSRDTLDQLLDLAPHNLELTVTRAKEVKVGE